MFTAVPFPIDHYAQVVHEYKSNGPNELDLKLEEIVHVLEEGDLGWCKVVNSSGKMGFAPISYLSYVKYDPTSKQVVFNQYENYYKFYKWECLLCKKSITTFDERIHCLDCESFDVFNICSKCYFNELKNNGKEKIEEEHLKKYGHKMVLTRMRKHPAYLHWLLSSPSSAETINRAFIYFSDRPCLGYRRKLQNGNFGEYVWLTYGEIHPIMLNLSCGLKFLIEEIHKKRGFVGICSKNRIEWFITDWACCLQSIVSVPIPRAKMLGSDLSEASHVVNNAECSIVVCSSDLVENFIQLAKEKCKSIKYIIQMENELDESLKKKFKNLKTFKEVISLGKKNKREIVKTSPDDLSTIVYTSGSTGIPKGAMITEDHWNTQIKKEYWPYHPLVCISFSPLDHMSDRLNSITTIVNGGRVGMYSGDMSLIFEDMKHLGPTILSSTPRLYNRIYGEYQKARALLKEKSEEELLAEFSKTLGGRMKALTTGGAPISDSVLEFLKKCFKIPVYNGYASTECGSICIFDNSTDNRKHLFEDVQVKLVDVPELGYYTTDKPYPRGEICVKSPQCIKGYYRNEEKTKELIDSDGWYHTGDIGQIDDEGKLTIIDRLKNIFKLSQGEYVAPETLENLYLQSKYIDQIFIYGDSLKSFVVAVVVPSSEFLSIENLYNIILEDIIRIGKEANRADYEIPKGIILEPQKFTPENGLLTSSFKLARIKLTAHYKNRLLALYDQLENQNHKDALYQTIFEIMGIKDKYKNFMEMGGDSLTASRVSNLLKHQFQINLPTDMLLRKDLTIEEISKFLSKATIDQLDLKKETTLDEHIKPSKEVVSQGITPIDKVLHIFLTGATGFVGPHLLEQLFKSYNDKCKIHCLVRAKSNELAMKRIHESLSRMQIKLTNDQKERIIAHSGDLSLPKFGLSEQEWINLSKEIDVIYHNGALVNSVYSYSQLHACNVKGTIQVIQLACISKLKPIYYISTIGVLGNPSKIIKENESLKESQFREISGYSQSKWVSEHLLMEARNRNVPIIIFRPGLIASHSVTGSANLIDWLNRFICGVIKLGFAPISDSIVKMVPVDFVCKAIVSITTTLRDEGFKKQVFHLLHLNQEGFSLNQMIKYINSFGYKIKQLEHKEWIQKMYKICKQDNPMYPILNLFESGFPEMDDKYFAIDNTKELMKKNDISCPSLSEDFMHNMLTFFILDGAIPKY